MKYRPEVDGLRAVAVIPVVLFHAGISSFQGGYVGVDIFFAISGYLITAILLSEHAEGTFSVLKFYERRARRILPALFVVISACIVLGWFCLPPGEWKGFARSILAVLTFWSNIFFWKETGYFDAATDLKPLLHTWSLAVEEQYYLLFPIFVRAAWRRGPRFLLVSTVALSVISAALAQWGLSHQPAATYYLLPTRAWELLAGSAAAMYLSKHAVKITPRQADVLTTAGLVLAIAPVFSYSPTTPFPGLYAIPPVLGALLVIVFAGAATLPRRLLSSKPIVGIGLISYSVYLWHQPLFAMAKNYSASPLTATTSAALVCATFILAFLSWRFVERPFRSKQTVTVPALWASAGSYAFVLGALSVFLVQVPFAWRANDAQIALDESMKNPVGQAPWQDCLNLAGAKRDYLNKPCVAGNGARTVALLGDSHAGTLHFELGQALSAQNAKVVLYAGASCPPIFTDRFDNPCFAYNRSYLQKVLEDRSIKTVFLVARWPLYLSGEPFDNGEGGVQKVRSNLLVEAHRNDAAKRLELLTSLYQQSIDLLLANGLNVVVMDTIPEPGWNPNDKVYKELRNARMEDLRPEFGSVDQGRVEARNASFDKLMQHYASDPRVTVVDVARLFCGKPIAGRCVVHLNGVPLYSDDNHPSALGAKIIASELALAAGNPAATRAQIAMSQR